jgi:hypothetical protein
MHLEYPINGTEGSLWRKDVNYDFNNNVIPGTEGSLWRDGKKAERLHNYFIENIDNFLNYDFNNDVIPINTRFSINFFGYKGKNWHKIVDCYSDDEKMLTIDFVKNRGFKNVFYSDFFVAHLSFYKQAWTGINSEDLLKKYDNLYYEMINKWCL